jgi:hypothetical protein
MERVAATLRNVVAPATGEAHPKTQAFMAAVVLTKLAAQMRQAESDERDAQDDHRALVAELETVLGPDTPPALTTACAQFRHERGDPAWNDVVRELYASRASIGAEVFEAALGAMRRALRRRLDRALVYAS